MYVARVNYMSRQICDRWENDREVALAPTIRCDSRCSVVQDAGTQKGRDDKVHVLATREKKNVTPGTKCTVLGLVLPRIVQLNAVRTTNTS
jgi:hypothetical protein